MFSLKGVAERTGFILLVLFLIGLGFFQGFQVHRFTVDLFFVVFEVLWLDAAVSSIGFAGFFTVSAVIYLVRIGRYASPQETPEGMITCIIPTYRDYEVLDRSVDSLLESSYDDFKVLIVCEEDDDEGIERAERLAEDDKVEYLVNTKYPGSKAGAMNYAVEEVDSEYIAFFDSDQRVRPNFLSELVSELQEHEIVQARNVPKPDGLIESLSYYESVFFTYISRQLLTLFTGFRLVGSRSVGMRKDVFEELGGYSDDTLVEDYDFAHKCYINKVDVADVPLPVENLAAHSFRDWWGQRKRWMTGYFQVMSKMFHKLFKDFSGRRSIFSVLLASGSLLGSFLMLTVVSKFLILFFLGAEMIYSVPVFSLAVIALAMRLHDRKYNFVDSIGFSWVAVPLVFPFFSIITVRSFLEFLFDRDMDWYRVEK
ncbi:MAG: glycosyltransferase family 2 protein [Candidatus Nanohalobium sp.]